MDQTTERVTAAATTPPAGPASAAQVFPGESEMARLMRAMDWSRTPLGPVETWSPSLRMMVQFLLANRFPLLLWWGPEFLQLYNDAYIPVLGTKHPQYLGRSVRECWVEIWDVIGPLIETPFNGGPATWMEDIQLEVNRHGFFEETHFTIAYSPVPDDTAPRGIGGVLATVHEISEKVVGDRRVLVLRDLGARAAEAKTAEEACAIAAETLAHHPKDVPFALLYLIDPDGRHARLAASAGIERDSALGPPVIALDAEPRADADADADAVRALAEAVRGETIQVVDDLAARGEAVPQGPWSDPPNSAVVVPIRSNIAHQLAGLLVAGVSARLRLDDAYLGFYELVSSQIATAIANARAYEEARKRAEALAEIDRAKTTFFSNVSHEFRTPLTLMLGPLGDLLAADGALPPEAHEQIEVIQRNGLRLAKLVNTLLDFSRIEADRAQAVYEQTDLPALTTDLASAFRSLVERAGLRFVVECPPLPESVGPVYVDRDMWEKIVLNLLSNAFKFTFAGEIAVTLRAVAAEGPADESTPGGLWPPSPPAWAGDRADAPRVSSSPSPRRERGPGGEDLVELEVRDTGVGIPADELPRLFERFHRVQGARARTFEGSGIGLALVQELVHLHGGTIRVESAEGVGTRVFARLPTGTAHLPAAQIGAGADRLASTALGAAPYISEAERWLPEEDDGRGRPVAPSLAGVESAQAPSALGAPPVEGPPARIVLADDNADMRDYLRRLLGEHYTVEAVANGVAALEAIRRQPPDLVVADVMMPELDGFGLLRALRDDPATSALPVILLSARAGEDATIEGLEAGADDYLVKPFSAREVLSRVAARLEAARARREVEARARDLEGTFEAIADATFVYDRDGKIVRTNSAARALFSLDELADYEEGSPQQRAALIAACDAQGRPLPPEESGLYRLLRGEVLTGADAMDVRLRLSDGRELEVNIAGAPLRDERGTIIGAIAISRDVTERRRLEREARWQASMLERAHDAIFMWELGGPIVYWNHGAELLYGFTRDEALGRVSHDLLQTQRPLPLDDFEAALERDGEWAGELTHTTRDGRQVIVLSRHQLLREPDGRRYVLESSRDISERRRLERRTQETLEALLQLVRTLVAAPEDADAEEREALGASIVELVRRIFQARFATLFVASTDESSGEAVLDFVAAAGYTPEQLAQVRARNSRQPLATRLRDTGLRDRLLAGEAVVLDLLAPQYAEQVRLYGATQAVIVPMRIGDRFVGTLGLNPAEGVTLTGDELALAEGVAQLAALVVERDRLLREREQARASVLALQDANHRMNEFLGIASHELRTPLTSIMGNVQMAERVLRPHGPARQQQQTPRPDADAEEQRQRTHTMLARTERQVRRLDRLVGDLLDMSRIQAGKLDLQPEPCDLAEIVRDAVHEQRTAWPGRAISLDLPRRASLVVRADADRIEQVVTNYLTNALKYSAESRPVAVRVRIRAGVVRVEVRDQGPGLSGAQQAHLFEQFSRVPGIQQLSGSGVGLGLGLYICRTIVERHGGRFGVESAPGAGSTFWFTLPLRPAPHDG